MMLKTNDTNFLVEKYMIVRDVTPFAKRCTGARRNIFEGTPPALKFLLIVMKPNYVNN